MAETEANPEQAAAQAPPIDPAAPEGEGSQERVLNQDEIDSLLGFDAKKDDAAVQADGIFAILNKSMTAYEKLPMMEVVFDRMVRPDDPPVTVNQQADIDPADLPKLLAGYDFVLDDHSPMPTVSIAADMTIARRICSCGLDVTRMRVNARRSIQ